jgi:hypothetical protein
MSHENSRLPHSLEFTLFILEPEPSSVIWLDTSIDVASGRPAFLSVDSIALF